MTRFAVLSVLAVAACGDSGPSSDPTFAGDVAAIIYSSCTPCHRPGGPTPFSLLSYDDVYKRRKQIVEVTGDRLMPPWLPSHGDFVGDRRLGDERIALLERWVETGAPRGDEATEPTCPDFPDGWQLREPDLIVSAREVIVPANGADAFRNLVIPVDVGGIKYVEAVEIQPGNPAVHHAVLTVDATQECRRLDALDSEPGFSGMESPSKPPDGHFVGWTPGKRVRPGAAGMAWQLVPGHDLVLQLHLAATGKIETVRPRVGLYFTDVAPTVVSYPLVLFSNAIDLPPGATDYVVRDEFVLPVPVTVHSVYPHAHYLCSRMVATVTVPGETKRDLFRIDRWDFDWQDDYRFREPFELPAGTRVGFEYRYDNSAANPQNPFSPPRRVQYGPESTDEMGTLGLQMTTADLDARRVLGEASLRHDLAKLGYNAGMLLQLTALLRDMGRIEEALSTVERVRQQEPRNATALYEQAACLQFAGRTGDAERAYIECINRDPNQNLARVQLANLMLRSGRTATAIELYEAALRRSPAMATVHNNLATAYMSEGRLDLAERHFQRAVAMDANMFPAWFNLGRVLAGMGRKAEAREALLRARALNPGDPRVAVALRDL